MNPDTTDSYTDSQGGLFLDAAKIKQSTGANIYDPSLKNTACGESSISFIDGEKGILTYRGYPIEQLVENCTFTEVAYLILKKELPNKQELDLFEEQRKNHTLVQEQLINFYNGFKRDSHPMSIMVGVVGALSSFYHDELDIHDKENLYLNTMRIFSKMPTLAAMSYKYAIGQPFVYPQNNLSFSENFLHMLFSVPSEDYAFSAVETIAFDTIFTLHAEHEFNASTTAVRVAASTGANMYACIASGIAALWGPLHGGANQAALKQLEDIGHPDNIPAYLAKVKDRNDPTRLMGFGHRVYKNFDPRSRVIQKLCHKLIAEKKLNSPIFDLALRLEEIALKDDYFKERHLYPNIDFYSGLILKALGIPANMFTVIFSISRTVGWLAHLNEQIESKQPIYRPRQFYVGPKERSINWP